MTLKSLTRRALIAFTIALTIGLLAVFNPALAGHPVAADIVPEGSTGYIHFYPQQIRNTPALDLFHRLLTHVQDEASTLSLSRLGFDATTLEEVTVVVAPLKLVMNAQGEPPCVVVASVATPFRAEDVRRSFGPGWRNASSDKQVVFENAQSGTSVHVFSETTLVVGPTDGVRWWMNTAGEEGKTSLSSLLANSLGHGHILLGCDFRDVPAEMRKMLPPLAMAYGEANFASLDIHFSDQMRAAAYLHFGSEREAKGAGRDLTNLLRQGTGLLAMTEAQFSAVVKDQNTNPDTAITGLFTLAIAREANRTLKNIEVNVDGVDLMAKVTIDQNLVSVIGLCLASIQAIGTQAEASFEDIADQIAP